MSALRTGSQLSGCPAQDSGLTLCGLSSQPCWMLQVSTLVMSIGPSTTSICCLLFFFYFCLLCKHSLTHSLKKKEWVLPTILCTEHRALLVSQNCVLSDSCGCCEEDLVEFPREAMSLDSLCGDVVCCWFSLTVDLLRFSDPSWSRDKSFCVLGIFLFHPR